MVWILAAVLLFFIIAGVRLLKASSPEQGTAEAAPKPAGPELLVGDDETTALRIVLAGRSRRFAARVIDTVVVIGLTVTISIVVASGASAGTELSRLRWVVFIVAVITAGGFEVGFIGTTGQTPGKQAMKIHVVALATGKRPSVGKAFARWVAPAITGTVLPVTVLDRDFLRGTGGLPSNVPSLVAYGVTVLLYATALWDEQRRGIHDEIAGTVVAAKPSSGIGSGTAP